MSFKREGDDKEQLDVLRKRRIRDLVGENVPDDEAKLLSNGKFTCLVCSYHPIFDTIDMLLVHRAGKKHEQGAAIFLEKQRELKNMIEKRKAEHFEKYGNTNIKIAEEHRNNRHLMSSTPYDARSKRLKPCDRKPKIHIGTMISSKMSTNTSQLSDLPGTSKGKWGHLSSSDPIMHDAKLKNIFRTEVKSSEDIKPYVGKRENINPASKQIPRESYSKREQIFCSYHQVKNIVSDVPVQVSVPSKHQMSPSDPAGEEVPSPKIVTDDQIQLSKKIQQLRGAGWKRDWDGKWIKDEDAEFDSDEEPPDI